MQHRRASDARPLDTEQSLDPRRILALLRRQFWIVIACAGLTLAATGLWLFQTVPIYTASTQLLLVPRKERALSSDAVIADLSADANSIATELTLVRSFSVANRVVERLKLDEDPSFVGRSGPSIMGWLRMMVPGRGGGEPASDAPREGREGQGTEGGDEQAEGPRPPDGRHDGATADGIGESRRGGTQWTGPTAADLPRVNGLEADVSPARLRAISRVQGGTSVQRLSSTYFILISYSHPEPGRAAAMANAVAESYLLEQLEARYQAARRAAGWLSERLSVLRVKLDKSEQELADFRAANNVISAKSGSIADQQAAEISQQLVAARAQTIEKQTKYEQAQRIAESGAGVETVAAIIDSPIIAALRQQELSIGRNEAEQLAKYGPDHPTIIRVRAERTDVRRQIRTEINRVVQQFRTDYELAQKKERSLTQSLEQLMMNARNNPVALKLRELETETNANRTLYESLLSRFKEAEQQTNYQMAESRVVAPANAPGSPSYPNISRTLMIALFGGLMLGVGAALLREYVENGFTTFEEVEGLLRLPVLTAVPVVSDAERRHEGQMLELPELVAAKPLSRVGESVRTARVATRMSDIDRPPKLVLITSSVPAEGKTTLALSLAYSSAAAGLRTLIIDGDLRHPSVSKFFGLEQRQGGLTDLLLGSIPPEQAFVRGPAPTLTILPAGTTTRHPPDVLGSEKLRLLLASVREAYDIVYIDAPPLMPVVDTTLLVPQVDKVVFVVQWRATAREVVQRSLQQVESSRGKIAGVVLNKVHLETLSTYSSYYGDYAKQYKDYYRH